MKLPKFLRKNNPDYMLNVFNPNDRDFYNYNGIILFGKLFIKIFGTLYSIYDISLHISIDEHAFIEELKKKYSLTQNHILLIEDATNNNLKKITDSNILKTFVLLKNGLAVGINYGSIEIYYNSSIEKAEVLEIASLSEEFKKPLNEKKEFHMVIREEKEFRLRDFEIKDYDIDIASNYNDDFKNVHEIITSTLNEQKKNGIILLHGNYGSGKTYYIRYLISSVKRKFVYMPLIMVDWISDPEFIPFLSRFKDCVLVIEDCEKLLSHRDNGNPNANALSNLLNLGDGLLSDAFSINVLCTFNANLQKIDDALLRKGRLIARYEFKELEIPKAQQLADKLQKHITVEKPMTLTDIYNAESMKFENKKAGRIGFAYA